MGGQADNLPFIINAYNKPATGTICKGDDCLQPLVGFPREFLFELQGPAFTQFDFFFQTHIYSHLY